MSISDPNDNHTRASLPTVAIWLHAVWLIVFLFLVIFGPFGSPQLEEHWLHTITSSFACGSCSEVAQNISSADQMGPLDLVSLSLTILGVIIGVSAFGSFFLIRGAAMDAASEEAKRTVLTWLNENKTKLLDSDVVTEVLESERIMTTLANEVKKRISEEQDEMSDTDADGIADAMDDVEEAT